MCGKLLLSMMMVGVSVCIYPVYHEYQAALCNVMGPTQSQEMVEMMEMLG